MVYTQGTAEIISGLPDDNDDLSLEAKNFETRLSSEECYAMFGKMGIRYGSAHQCVEEIKIGSDTSGAWCLAQLKLRNNPAEPIDQYHLHPGLTDSAIQAAVVFLSSLAKQAGSPLDNSIAPLPFSVEDVEARASFTEVMTVMIRPSAGNVQDGAISKLDIVMKNSRDEIALRLSGFTWRLRSSDSRKALVFSRPVWRAEEGEPSDASSSPLIAAAGLSDAACAALSKKLQADVESIGHLRSTDDGSGILSTHRTALEMVKNLLATRSATAPGIIAVVPGGEEAYLYAPLAGLFRTAQLENPNFSGRLMYIDSYNKIETEILGEMIRMELDQKRSSIEVKYGRDGERLIKAFELVNLESETDPEGLTPGGVYWITGGLGGLGRLFVQKYFQESNVTLVLSGRSEINADTQKEISSFSNESLKVEYIRADVSSQEDVDRVVKTITDRYGKLNGVLHCAGVVNDAFIISKDLETIDLVMQPKVKGLINIDRGTKDIDLDFLALFSSVASAFGSSGQSDYSAANSFLDEFSY